VLYFLHIQRDPKQVGNERHVSEENAQDAESKGFVLPHHRVQQWKWVIILPYRKSYKAENTKEEHYDDLERVPAQCWAFPEMILAQAQ
jgi:hypothetical protein